MNALAGMDIDEVEVLARHMDNAARRLSSTRIELDRMATTSAWLGADASGFLRTWATYRSMLDRTANDLSAQAKFLHHQIEEQRSASGEEGGVGTRVSGRDDPISPETLLRWLMKHGANAYDDFVHSAYDGTRSALQGAAQWQQDRFAEMVDWTSDRGRDLHQGVDTLLEAGRDHWEATSQAFDRYSEVAGHLNQQLSGFHTGNPPTMAELAATGLILGGLQAGVYLNAATGSDAHLFDDGTPWAGRPTLLNEKDRRFTATQDASAVAAQTFKTYEDDGVRVTVVSKPGQPDAYVVSIPGTAPDPRDPAGWMGHWNGRDWPANLYGVSYGKSSGSEAVAMAMENFGIPPGSKVMLAGHSQGGIIAANVAADPAVQSRYDIAGVMAWGAPVECANIPTDTPVVSFEHGADIVPQLDLGGAHSGIEASAPDNLTKVSLPVQFDKFGIPSIWSNHHQDGYEVSMRNLDHGDAALLRRFESQSGASDFYTSDPTQVKSYNVPFGRRPEFRSDVSQSS